MFKILVAFPFVIIIIVIIVIITIITSINTINAILTIRNTRKHDVLCTDILTTSLLLNFAIFRSRKVVSVGPARYLQRTMMGDEKCKSSNRTNNMVESTE